MKKYVVASVLVFGLTGAAWAATENMYFVTVDTVKNCSISHGKPSAGQTALGETGGYANRDDAKKFLDSIRNDEAKCAGVVE
ncbi:MAG: hypothetical protein R6X03_03415 [Methyloceanibacter sp.]|jgi:hypothetical protein